MQLLRVNTHPLKHKEVDRKNKAAINKIMSVQLNSQLFVYFTTTHHRQEVFVTVSSRLVRFYK